MYSVYDYCSSSHVHIHNKEGSSKAMMGLCFWESLKYALKAAESAQVQKLKAEVEHWNKFLSEHY